MTDVVWDELVTTKASHVNAEMQALLDAVAGAPRPVEPMSPEAATFTKLLPKALGRSLAANYRAATSASSPQWW